MEKEYYDAQVKYINEIRSIRHDMQAHMIVLQYYLESENYEKAKSYLGDMKQNQSSTPVIVKDTGHDLVNAIVADTLSRSTKEIDFEIKGILPTDFVMTEYDVCTLFSNIFSNAREACEKLVCRKPVILMEVQEQNHEYLISVQNPIEWEVQTNGGGLLTSKSDKKRHGFGTQNMIKTVMKYKGKIDFLISDKSFRVEVRIRNQK